jgi:hypothetical protein
MLPRIRSAGGCLPSESDGKLPLLAQPLDQVNPPRTRTAL